MDVTLQKMAKHADDETRPWVERGARFGHFTKGVIYALMGALALQVALGSGGELAGSKEAAAVIGEQPFGKVLLGLLGVGLVGYAVWRCVVGIKDVERKGSDAKGLLHRAGAVIAGLVNGALAVALFQMALGQGSAEGGTRTWVAKLMGEPFGVVLTAVVGVCIVGVGIGQLYLAYSKKFLQYLALRDLSANTRRWITRLGQVGYGARGIVFPIIGIALVEAARRHDPGEAKDMPQALNDLSSSGAGQWLLGLVAAGFIAYGAFMLVSARYRRCSV